MHSEPKNSHPCSSRHSSPSAQIKSGPNIPFWQLSPSWTSLYGLQMVLKKPRTQWRPALHSEFFEQGALSSPIEAPHIDISWYQLWSFNNTDCVIQDSSGHTAQGTSINRLRVHGWPRWLTFHKIQSNSKNVSHNTTTRRTSSCPFRPRAPLNNNWNYNSRKQSGWYVAHTSPPFRQ